MSNVLCMPGVVATLDTHMSHSDLVSLIQERSHKTVRYWIDYHEIDTREILEDLEYSGQCRVFACMYYNVTKGLNLDVDDEAYAKRQIIYSLREQI